MQDKFHLEIRVVPMQLEEEEEEEEVFPPPRFRLRFRLVAEFDLKFRLVADIIFVDLDYIYTCENKSRYNAPHLHICT